MANALVINGHQPHAASPGRLNAAFAEIARETLRARDFRVRAVSVAEPLDTEQQVENQVWADLILLQFPLNSMGLPWSLKRYLDEVYTAGMDGRLAKGDGRSRSDPSRQYGSGGLMTDTSYGLSVTLNAPEDAFSDPDQALFSGHSLDDLLAPVHINFAFFGLQALPTFAAFNVKKSPQLERDFDRFRDHVATLAP